MGGTWGKEQELEIIKSGGIHYKHADIHEVSVNIIERDRHPLKQNYTAGCCWRQ